MTLGGKRKTKKPFDPTKLKLNKKGQPILPSEYKKNLSLGQKAADGLTSFVGSWAFLIGLFVLLIIWVTINVIEVIFQPWDPYPFILLNFFLSCIAAMQAPIILMSQNREAEKDRTQQRFDYLVDRKAEREIQQIQKEVRSIKNYIMKIHKISKEIKTSTDESN